MEALLSVIIAICVCVIYDARIIIKKYFRDDKKNNMVLIMRISAFFVGIISMLILYFI